MVRRLPDPRYAGYAKNPSAEVGEQILEAAAQDLARSIRAIKEDTRPGGCSANSTIVSRSLEK